MKEVLRDIGRVIIGLPFFAIGIGLFIPYTALFLLVNFVVAKKDRVPLKVYFLGSEEYGPYPTD